MHVSRALYNDLKAARSAQAQASKAVVVETLTKAGVPSKSRDATHFFNTELEAQGYIERIERNNPTRTFNFRISVR
jgi:hypothetical protein